MLQPGELRGSADWLNPPSDEEGLRSYVATIRERRWIVAATVLIATAVAALYVATAEKVYEAEAEVLITPVSSQNQALVGLPLLFESSDPTRNVETAARLVTTYDVAARVSDELDSPESPEALLADVTAEPVAQSNIVAVTAQAGSPEDARDLANAFAEEAVAERTDRLHDAIEAVIPQLETQADEGEVDPAGVSIASQVAQLETLLSTPDPTMRVAALAETPGSQVAPKPVLSVAGGLVAGLVLGIALAFVVQVLDPRLRREEQLRRLYRLPILARIPRESRRKDTPLTPANLTPAASEAYRTLRGTLSTASRATGDRGAAILVTGSSPSEGKTTTGLNLATSLAAAGKTVLLIEADLRRPSIGKAVGITPDRGVVSVLVESMPLADAVITSDTYGANLGFLLADHEGEWLSELFSLPAAAKLIDEARELADFVIVDSPPLTDVVDALLLARYVDHVLIVARLGETQLSKLARLGELLAENGVRPIGFAVVGTRRPTKSDYHYYVDKERRLFKDRASSPSEVTSGGS